MVEDDDAACPIPFRDTFASLLFTFAASGGSAGEGEGLGAVLELTVVVGKSARPAARVGSDAAPVQPATRLPINTPASPADAARRSRHAEGRRLDRSAGSDRLGSDIENP